jgi:GxxExxY protein
MDLVVENLIIVEIKAIEQILKINEVQVLSYLRLHNKSLGLLINFHVPALKDGVRRIVNNFKETPRLGVSALEQLFDGEIV